MNKNFKTGKQGGFTLIELIVVIVILGILAATALPKFADLSSDARVATLKAAKGSVNSVAVMAHAKALVTSSPTGNVTMEGVTFGMINGYPTASKQLGEAAGLGDAAGLGPSDFVVTVGTPAANAPNSMTVSPKGVATPGTCHFVYTEAASATTAPTWTENFTNCN